MVMIGQSNAVSLVIVHRHWFEGSVSVLYYLRSNVLSGSSRVGIAFNGKMLRAFLSRQLESWTIRL